MTGFSSSSYLFIFTVLLCFYGADFYQNEVGSGDDDLTDNEVPNAQWDNSRTSGTARNRPEDRNRPGSDSNLHGRDQALEEFWEIDEVGSGGDEETVRTNPGVQQPGNFEPSRPADIDDDLIGGDGIIVDNGNPDDVMKPCSDDFCNGNGQCDMVHNNSPVCRCAPGFVGIRCEQRDVVIRPQPDEEGPDVSEAKKEKSHLMEIISNPIAIAVFAVSGLLFIALIVTMLVCCCRCIRKKDEGSYTLDEALHNPKVEYTKVPNSQEFYA